MRAWLGFWGKCVKWAFLRWETGEAASVLGGPLLIQLLSWSSALLAAADLGLAYDGGSIPWLLLAVPFVAILFLVAPYELWKSERLRAETAEKTLDPQLVVETEIVLVNPKEARCALLIHVSNTGIGVAKDCVGYLHHVYRLGADGIAATVIEIPSMNLSWSLDFGKRQDPSTDIAVAADLNVIGAVEIASAEEPFIAFAVNGVNSSYPPGKGMLVLDSTKFLFDIEIRQSNHAPVRKEYCLDLVVLPATPPEGQGKYRSNNKIDWYVNY